MSSIRPASCFLACCFAILIWSHRGLAESPNEASHSSQAPDQPSTDERKPLSVEEIAERAKKSVVVVSFTDLEGKAQGVGSGFIVSPDGLVATNLHVIREARPILVKTTDGQEYDVVAIHATEEGSDLAVLRIEAKDLPALELGDSDALKQGQDVVAIGHPQELKFSVVSGVVSGRREIDGRQMIQLAIPIERGNSGGPLLDRYGRVQGILTLKSTVTANLGYAMEVNALKPLLDKPNPISMDRWLRLGALDPEEWEPLFGALWRKRGGRILVEGRGQGLGRRSLCLSQADVPDAPFEVGVTVRLKDEDGAAGLVFHADGGNLHYGFYPSGGRIRLSRFDGPDVYSWQVLEQVDTPYYKPGEWNRLKIRIEAGAIKGYVNDRLIVTSHDARYTTGRVGLAQFRETEAEFKSFQIAKEIPSLRPSPELEQDVAELVGEISPDRPPQPELVNRFTEHETAAMIALRERADQLEQQAERLRQLARAVHVNRVQSELAELLQAPEGEIDLFHAALLVAALDNESLETEVYRKEVDRMTEAIRKKVPQDADVEQKLATLNDQFFGELGYHGSRTDYYSRSNSYMNQVIDDRKGLPITLSVLYMELARRLGLNVVGVGMPGHFIVRFEPGEGDARLIDVFNRGAVLTRDEAAQRVAESTGRPIRDDDLATTTKKAVIIRMLHNLFGIARDETDAESMLRYVDTIVKLDPEAAQPGTATDRWLRAVLHFQTDRIAEARVDVGWLLEKQPEEINMIHVRQLERALEATDSGGN